MSAEEQLAQDVANIILEHTNAVVALTKTGPADEGRLSEAVDILMDGLDEIMHRMMNLNRT